MSHPVGNEARKSRHFQNIVNFQHFISYQKNTFKFKITQLLDKTISNTHKPKQKNYNHQKLYKITLGEIFLTLDHLINTTFLVFFILQAI